MEKLTAISEKMWRITSIISGFILAGYMVLVVVNVLMRKLGGRPIFGIIELICYLSLVACCFALAQTEWKNGNVTMTLVRDYLKPKAQAVFAVVVYAICFVAFIYVFVQCLLNAADKYRVGGATPDLYIPLYIITYLLAAGFIMLDICIFIKLILRIGEMLKVFRGEKKIESA